MERGAAGRDPAAPKPAAAEQRRHVQRVTAQPAAIGCRRQETDVAGKGPQIADMIGDPLQLESQRAPAARARRTCGAGEAFEDLAIGCGVADRAVSDNGFSEMSSSAVRAALQRPLDPAVLVSERDFEMDDLFAVAIETKMPGLDDPGVDRSYRDFVDFRAGHREEIRFPDGGAGGREANRLQPGMALRIDAPLLIDLALKMVRRWAVHRQRRTSPAHPR